MSLISLYLMEELDEEREVWGREFIGGDGEMLLEYDGEVYQL